MDDDLIKMLKHQQRMHEKSGAHAMALLLENSAKEIERLRFLVTQGRHDLFKKKLITFDEVKNWQI